MTRTLEIAHLCVLLAVLALAGTLGWRAWSLMGKLDAVLSPVPATEAKLNLELDEAHRLTLEAGLTAMEARKASAEELAYLPKWDKQISETFRQSDETIAEARETIAGVRETADAATETFRGASMDLQTLNGSLTQTKPLIEAATATVQHIDALTPDLMQTNANLRTVSGNLAASTADFQVKFHAILFPPKCKTFGCRLKRSWPIIKDVTGLANPLYFGLQSYDLVTGK